MGQSMNTSTLSMSAPKFLL